MKCAHLVIVACLALMASDLPAQNCGPNEIFLKNDGLPDVPIGPLPVGLFPGLCDSQPYTPTIFNGCLGSSQVTPVYGEAIVCVFDISAYSSVTVKSAHVMAAGVGGSPFFNFAVDCEFYDGLQGAQGARTLGNQVFDLQSATGNIAQLNSHAINTIDLTPYNVVASGPTLVMAIRMEINLNGSCLLNIVTQQGGTSAGFASDLIGPTLADRNFIHGIDLCSGAALPTLADASTFGGQFFIGNWIMRVCIEPGPLLNPLQTVFPVPLVTSGSQAIVNFVATPSFGGHAYLGIPSLTLAPAGSPIPVLLTDFMAASYLAGDPFITSLFTGFSGVIPPSGIALGILTIPPLPPTILPLQLHAAFATINGGAITGISSAGTLTIQ